MSAQDAVVVVLAVALAVALLCGTGESLRQMSEERERQSRQVARHQEYLEALRRLDEDQFLYHQRKAMREAREQAWQSEDDFSAPEKSKRKRKFMLDDDGEVSLEVIDDEDGSNL